MTIVTSNYRPERALRKKRPLSENVPTIVTPAPMKKRQRPVIRLSEQQLNDTDQEQPRRSAIVEPKRKPGNSMLAHLLDHDGTDDEHRRASDMAQELFREIVRRAALPPEK